VKLTRISLLFITLTFIFSCSPSPIAKSLLSNPSTTTTTEVPASNDGDLEIVPDNTNLSVNIDTSDRAEVTGTCKDLDRRKNRILVEVYAGDPNTGLTPYISNALSDKCQTTASGLPITDKCFFVTKGLGLVEDLGLPSERSFPQCHNGRFGFSVKLGKAIETATVGTFDKYVIRIKLRTTDGILSDSVVSEVNVDRNIATPVIDSLIADQDNFSCNLKMSVARFNPFIQYTLNRTYTDAASSDVTQAPLFSGKTTASIIDNDSVFSWKDDNFAFTHAPSSVRGVIAGVSYTYTLTATDTSFVYSSAPTKTSTPVTCTMDRPTILPNGNPTAGTCYLFMSGKVRAGVQSQWGISTIPAWTGPNGDGTAFTNASCEAAFLPTGCTRTGLTTGVTYYFAVRDTFPDIIDPTKIQIGRWSNIVSCRP
jgi:hypothetical protein